MKRRFFYDTEFIESPGSIDLISLGIVSEDGERKLHMVSSEFDESAAGDWVREHVLPKLPPASNRASRAEIRDELLKFLAPSKADPVEMWAYYGAYDHVVLCWLFGTMVELPKGMPKLTMDVKQLCKTSGDPQLPSKPKNAHDALADAEWTRQAWLFLQDDKE